MQLKEGLAQMSVASRYATKRRSSSNVLKLHSIRDGVFLLKKGIKMNLKYFYFVIDDYFVEFNDNELMKNKDSIKGSLHSRPCYYAIKEEKSNIYWMIPISSKIDKYKAIHDAKVKRNKRCDTIVFGNVLGKERAFLIQNMFPIIDKYISCEYRDLKTKELVRIDKILEAELETKANKVLFLERKGIKVLLPNVLEIESKLIQMQLEKNESIKIKDENNEKVESFMKTLKKVQKEFEGDAEKAGITDEDDVQKFLEENKEN